MPQSLANLLVHLVFSTKERRPLLADRELRAAMHRHLAVISGQLACPVTCIGGVEDHVHCLVRLSRTITVADWVKELKRVSTNWAKSQHPSLHEFQWQGGYGAFSVSQSQSLRVQEYIQGQEEHHRRTDFRRELRQLLEAHGMDYDERYICD